MLEHKDIKVNKATLEGLTPLGMALLKLKQGDGRRREKIVALLKERVARPRNDTLTCIVCLDRKVDVVLVPCGHQNLCGACAHQLDEDHKRCPTDRSHVLEILPLSSEEGPGRKRRRYDWSNFLG